MKKFSRNVTLLVQGTLRGDNVTDKLNNRSSKVIQAHTARQAGRHIHIIDSAGFTRLLHHERAACLRSTPVGDILQLSAPTPPTTPTVPVPARTILGAPLTARSSPTHAAVDLALDLSGLDRGTAAREDTVQGLRHHEEQLGLTAFAPATGMPQFDVGWVLPNGLVFIAEVKSLTDTNESQQIRLAIGQVLDYVAAVREATTPGGPEVQPVVVLEHAPQEFRWVSVATSVTIVLLWGPDFRVT